nr:histidine kinase [Bifidobacterium saguinibicoloris]
MTYGAPIPPPASPVAAPRTPTADDVPTRTRGWCTALMIAAAMLSCLTYVSFAAQPYIDDPHGARYLWFVLATLIAIPFPFTLLARGAYPEATFWACCAVVAVFPYGSAPALIALSSMLARRDGRARTARAVAAGAVVAVWAQLRDVLRPADESFWHMVFAKPHTGVDGEPIVMLVGDPTIAATAVVTGLVAATVATLIGLHIRSKVRLRTAQARTDAAVTHAQELSRDLAAQRLADAIAAEAHDTLAHTLSLLALNASALQAQTLRMQPTDGTRAVARQAEEIRRQAAGALDEAHQIIDMLRHPQQAWEQLAPTAETALTRESLDALLGESRAAGMRIDTWIDIRQLGELDDAAAKVAYRAIQEGLTNACRHAPGSPVSLEVTASPERGVHVHAANRARTVAPPSAAPVTGTTDASDTAPATPHRRGAGLAGLASRARAAGGSCRFGTDDAGVFHLDVALPWRTRAAHPGGTGMSMA